MRSEARIYLGQGEPLPVKPASHIDTWDDWPEDVQPILRRWNKRIWVRMSFRRSAAVFTCVDCGEFCLTHRNGAAVFNSWSDLHQEWSCDDCLILRARAFKPVLEHMGEAARNGVEHHGCTCQTIDLDTRTCAYHLAAAAFPLDHRIPWNCPTFYDGCNCTRPKVK